MGVDALDLSFRLEKRLGIRIQHAEIVVAFFDTPATLHRYLVAKLKGECKDIPAMEPLFRELANAISSVRGRWRPDATANLNRVFPASHREANWRSLQTALGVSLPPLQCLSGEEELKVPPNCDSMRSLAYWIVENRPERVEWLMIGSARFGELSGRAWTDEEVWEIMCDCIVAALGVKPEAVTPDARLVEDLGME
ncbi:MAG: hypothetical protein ABFC96_09870 [Thermoguttaceae bacterium]